MAGSVWPKRWLDMRKASVCLGSALGNWSRPSDGLSCSRVSMRRVIQLCSRSTTRLQPNEPNTARRGVARGRPRRRKKSRQRRPLRELAQNQPRQVPMEAIPRAATVPMGGQPRWTLPRVSFRIDAIATREENFRSPAFISGSSLPPPKRLMVPAALSAPVSPLAAALAESRSDRRRARRLHSLARCSSAVLAEAIRYCLLAPGKRLRPTLVLWSAAACGCTDDTSPAGGLCGRNGLHLFIGSRRPAGLTTTICVAAAHSATCWRSQRSSWATLLALAFW